MSATALARSERAQLVSLLRAVGPGHPTLCNPWQTGDLLAHLLVRERKPLGALGIVLSPMRQRTATVMAQVREMPWPEQLRLLAAGPPRWNPMSLPRVDGLSNAAEFFVHHEDVRRATDGWTERLLDEADTAALLCILPMVARMALRHLPYTVRAVLAGASVLLRKRGPQLTVTGRPGEVLLWCYGRTAVHVTVEGTAHTLARYPSYPRGI